METLSQLNRLSSLSFSAVPASGHLIWDFLSLELLNARENSISPGAYVVATGSCLGLYSVFFAAKN
jgi:hypothetical protein